MATILDTISETSFLSVVQLVANPNYYNYFFPFLLLFAIFFQVCTKVLGTKGSKLLTKSTSFIISIAVSLFSVAYTFPSGYTIGDMMMFVFPNISSITIMILLLYVVGSILGVDFFTHMFRRDTNAYFVFAVGLLGLGSVIYYGGIVLGLWSFDPYDDVSRLEMTLSIGILIFGIVCFIIGWFALGITFLYVSGMYFFNLGSVPLTDLLFDPILFIIFIILTLVTWIGTNPEDEKQFLRSQIKESEKTIEQLRKNNGGDPKQGKDLLYDINIESLESRKKKWKELYGDEEI